MNRFALCKQRGSFRRKNEGSASGTWRPLPPAARCCQLREESTSVCCLPQALHCCPIAVWPYRWRLLHSTSSLQNPPLQDWKRGQMCEMNFCDFMIWIIKKESLINTNWRNGKHIIKKLFCHYYEIILTFLAILKPVC